MSLTVKQDFVMVEAIKATVKQVGLLQVVGGDDKKTQQGKVIAVGDGILADGKIVPLDVKVGDIVLYDHTAGHTTKMDHKDYLLLRETEIIAIVE